MSATLADTNPSKQYAYAYDSRGNMTGVTTQVAAGTATEVRTFNDLNQLLTNAVTPVGGGTTNWTYTYNLDGTLASKFDGTNTTAYTWDPGGDQRLLSVSLNGVTQVAYTYDSLGRMLTRTPYSGGVAQAATNFEWDSWDCVREFAPAGTYRYYAPQGELITFDYTPTAGATSTYCLHADALGSVRMITDSTGASVAHYEYDAWGSLLASSADISFGFNYRYVGSLGVRYDATSGLYYMKHRWYDSAAQRFISRDPLGLKGGRNLYGYVRNCPTSAVDPLGLKSRFDITERRPNPYSGSDFIIERIRGFCDCEGNDEVVSKEISFEKPENLYPSNFPDDWWTAHPEELLKPRLTTPAGMQNIFPGEIPVNEVSTPVGLIVETIEHDKDGNGWPINPMKQTPAYGYCVCRRCDGSTYKVKLYISDWLVYPDYPQ